MLCRSHCFAFSDTFRHLHIISLPCYYSDLHFIYTSPNISYHIKRSPKKKSTTPHFHIIIQSKCVCVCVSCVFFCLCVLNPANFRSNLPRNRDVLVGWQDLLNEIASSSRRLRAARGGAQDAAGGAPAAVTSGPGPGRSRSPESRPRPGGCWGGSLPRGGGDWGM